MGSSPALAICETSQVLLSGVPGVFSRGSPVFAPPTDWPVSYELKKRYWGMQNRDSQQLHCSFVSSDSDYGYVFR